MSSLPNCGEIRDHAEHIWAGDLDSWHSCPGRNNLARIADALEGLEALKTIEVPGFAALQHRVTEMSQRLAALEREPAQPLVPHEVHVRLKRLEEAAVRNPMQRSIQCPEGLCLLRGGHSGMHRGGSGSAWVNETSTAVLPGTVEHWRKLQKAAYAHANHGGHTEDCKPGAQDDVCACGLRDLCRALDALIANGGGPQR